MGKSNEADLISVPVGWVDAGGKDWLQIDFDFHLTLGGMGDPLDPVCVIRQRIPCTGSLAYQPSRHINTMRTRTARHLPFFTVPLL